MTYLIGLGVIVGAIAVLCALVWMWNQLWFFIAGKECSPGEAGEIGLYATLFAAGTVLILYVLFFKAAPKVGEAVLGWWG